MIKFNPVSSKVFLGLLLPFSSQAKEGLQGMWLIDQVKVGEKEMTPVAKWLGFKLDVSDSAGNGWLQNSGGIYDWDLEKGSLKTTDSLSIADPFGAFEVVINGDSMRWKRAEEGMQVEEFAHREEQVPMAPHDYLVGMWKLNSRNEKKDDPAEHLFFKWDRNLLSWKNGTRSRGLWNFNAHQPIVSTMTNDQKCSWGVKVDKKKQVLRETLKEGSSKSIEYISINHFPK